MENNIGLTDKDGVTVWMHPFEAKHLQDPSKQGYVNKYVIGCDPICDNPEVVFTPRHVFDVEKIGKQIVVIESKLRALLDSNKITLKEYLRWIKSY